MATPLRYDDLGTVNAVKLSQKIDSYENYIQLYTEIDSHIEEGDMVFISYSGNTSDINTQDLLDNFMYITYSNDFIYNEYANGYKVIYVDKNLNTFVINRPIYTITPNSKLYGHYVSKVICNNINVKKANIDGAFFRKSYFGNSANTQLGDINILQGVSLGGDLFNSYVNDKYDTGYVSLLLKYDSVKDINTKYYNLNNNDFGYSYFYDLTESVRECIINSGNYINCSIYSNVSGNTINGGYFNYCLIDNYTINDGYFYNSYLVPSGDITNKNMVWNYGRWDGTTGYDGSGNTFILPTWKNGVFINGIFGDSNLNYLWENGDFMNGVWRGSIWVNGNFYGGLFEGTGKTIEFSSSVSQNTGSEWLNGKFAGGRIYPNGYNSIYFKDGVILAGEINNVSMDAGKIYGGDFYNVSIKKTEIYGGDFNVNRNSSIINNYFASNKIYDGNFNGLYNDSYIETSGSTKIETFINGHNNISDSIIYNGVFKYSYFYNNNVVNNGNFTSCNFLSPLEINNGDFSNSGSRKVYDKNIVSIKSYTNNEYFNVQNLTTPGTEYNIQIGFMQYPDEVYAAIQIYNLTPSDYNSILNGGNIVISNSPINYGYYEDASLDGEWSISSITDFDTEVVEIELNYYPYFFSPAPWIPAEPYVPSIQSAKLITTNSSHLTTTTINNLFDVIGDNYENVKIKLKNSSLSMFPMTGTSGNIFIGNTVETVTFIKLSGETYQNIENLYAIKFSNTNKYFKKVYDNTLTPPINIIKWEEYGSLSSITQDSYFIIEPVFNTAITSIIQSSNNSMSKATIRSKTLMDSNNTLQFIYLEFDNGHNFNMYNNGDGDDIGVSVSLSGFKSQDLWEMNSKIIPKNTYKDPSELNSNGDALYVKPIGDNYIILETLYKPWYFNDTGVVKKIGNYNYTSLVKKDKYDILKYYAYNTPSSNTYIETVNYSLRFYNSSGKLAFACRFNDYIKVGTFVYQNYDFNGLTNISGEINYACVTVITKDTNYISAVTNKNYSPSYSNTSKLYVVNLSVVIDSDKVDNVGDYVKIISDFNDPYTATTLSTNVISKSLITNSEISNKVKIDTKISYLKQYNSDLGYDASRSSKLLLDSPIIINDGNFKNYNIYNKVIVNDGMFVNTNLMNGIIWNNGSFDTGVFMSSTKINENVWYDGNFYGGNFGKNVSGSKPTSTITFFGGLTKEECRIDDKANSPTITTGINVPYKIEKIIPVYYNKLYKTYSYEFENNSCSGQLLGQPWWMADYVFNENITSYSLPYLLSFKVNCKDITYYNTMISYLDQVKKFPDKYSVDLIDPQSRNTIGDNINNLDSKEPYKTFKSLFDMDYEFKDYVKNPSDNSIFIIFNFITIKNIWDNATTDENKYYVRVARSMWSLVNCGYYTYPLPVLEKNTLNPSPSGPLNFLTDPKYHSNTTKWNDSNLVWDWAEATRKNYIGGTTAKNTYWSSRYGTEDLNLVGKMSLLVSDDTYITNSKWIYGTMPPPWWINSSSTYKINNITRNLSSYDNGIWIYIANRQSTSYEPNQFLPPLNEVVFKNSGFYAESNFKQSPINAGDYVTFGPDCDLLSNNNYRINSIWIDSNNNLGAINITAELSSESWSDGDNIYSLKGKTMTFDSNIPYIDWDIMAGETPNVDITNKYIKQIGTRTNINEGDSGDNLKFEYSIYNNGNPTYCWYWNTAGPTNNVYHGLNDSYDSINSELFSWAGNNTLEKYSMWNNMTNGRNTINFLKYNPYPQYQNVNIERTIPGWMFKWQGAHNEIYGDPYDCGVYYNANATPILLRDAQIHNYGTYVDYNTNWGIPLAYTENWGITLNTKYFMIACDFTTISQISIGDYLIPSGLPSQEGLNVMNGKVFKISGIQKGSSYGTWFQYKLLLDSLQTPIDVDQTQNLITTTSKCTIVKSGIKNFQDIVVFNSYFKFKEGISTNHRSYSYAYGDNPIYCLLNSMHNNNNYISLSYNNFTMANYNYVDLRTNYSYFLSNSEKFKKLNSVYQTSMQNFKKQAGIQIYTKNVLLDKNTYIDSWYGGQFYNGTFEGVWNNSGTTNSTWIGGFWNGWNSFYDTLDTPITTKIIEKINYEVNYSLLKRQRLYYEIAPWDDANKKKTEIVNKPLRREDRSF